MRQKTIRSLIRALALAAGALLMTSNLGNAAAATETSAAIRTFSKIKAGEPVTIAYFGGSITAGAGASNGEKTSYRALTTTWLKQEFPNAKIKAVNAAIGGTGSDLGAFRCQNDVLSQKPDLVFVEFAVNDGGAKEIRAKEAMEGIVRQIWKANPKTEIIFIYTTSKALFPPYEKEELPKAVKYHSEVADYYGIPQINVGQALYEKIKQENAQWETYLKDGVHPSDNGYQVYFETIKTFLTPSLQSTQKEPAPKALPKSLTQRPLENARIAEAKEAQASDGWQDKEPMLNRFFKSGAAGNTPGSELTFKFNGSIVGVFWVIAADSGDISWSIDGAPAKNRSSWDKYALKFNRKGYTILADDLTPGEHTLTIKILEAKNEQSTGNWVRIGSFLVN